ncbi:2-hydroxyacid dehydrogenase [Sodalis ligni]|uniref:Glyoxylate/hydroxypyruvate reductase A n=1 Tax=Sodalis ligni TaxID=2697027 RepID=A0A4R1N516_9GAMM|nr:glyoxylate/hydroxypyruvate reductase A [Sodalis ligni]TCL02294.1 glyoxylate/hydroxypyruvate reductase A [Sodalis ligni]
MDIIYYHPSEPVAPWIAGMGTRLSGAHLRAWLPEDRLPADYALVWHPPAGMLTGRTALKGVFILGAGVDALMQTLRLHPLMLPESIPLMRLEDAGMAEQMVEYVLAAVLRYYRRLDEYLLCQSQGTWRELPLYDKRRFIIGVAGAGVLGQKVAKSLADCGFPVRCWSLTRKSIPDVDSFAGDGQLPGFLAGLQVLVNLLPNTPRTEGILDAELFALLNRGAFVINVARGAHLVEADLLAALAQGQIAAATLDVCRQEPLPPDHPFWHTPRITLTPHIAAVTVSSLAMDSIAENIRRIEAGEPPVGLVDRDEGY